MRRAIIWFDDHKKAVWWTGFWFVLTETLLWAVLHASGSETTLWQFNTDFLWHLLRYWMPWVGLGAIAIGVVVFGVIAVVDGYKRIVRWARAPEFVASQLEARQPWWKEKAR